jgi:hypothetical protein
MRTQGNTYCKYLAFLLLGIYLSATFRYVMPFIEYESNYEYISTVLCENRDKPSLHCNGKCFLNKEIKKLAKEESRSNQKLQKDTESKEFVSPVSELELCLEFNYLEKCRVFYKEKIFIFIPEYSTPPPRIA